MEKMRKWTRLVTVEQKQRQRLEMLKTGTEDTQRERARHKEDSKAVKKKGGAAGRNGGGGHKEKQASLPGGGERENG